MNCLLFNLWDIESNYWAISEIIYWIFFSSFDWVLDQILRICNMRQKNWELSYGIRNIYFESFLQDDLLIYLFRYMPS